MRVLGDLPDARFSHAGMSDEAARVAAAVCWISPQGGGSFSQAGNRDFLMEEEVLGLYGFGSFGFVPGSMRRNPRPRDGGSCQFAPCSDEKKTSPIR